MRCGETNFASPPPQAPSTTSWSPPSRREAFVGNRLTDKLQIIALRGYFLSTLPTVERKIAKWLSDFWQKTTVERFKNSDFCGKMVLQTKGGAAVV